MDLESLFELDVTALMVSLVVGVMTWYSVFMVSGLGWDEMAFIVRLVVVIAGFVVPYFVTVMIINK